MARLRYNNALGALGASLTNSGTTITFAVAPAFATLTGSDYIPIVLEPPTTSPSANFEVVYLTAYTAAATTGTISRGQEGTTGVVHSNGVAWAVAPSVLDAYQPTDLQNGVIGSADLAASSISINTSTGALTVTLAAAEPCWVADANGLLVPVYFPSTGSTITPSLPASTKYAVIGVEIDTHGTVTLVKGADTATQLNTALLIAANTPATSSGKVRVADFAVWNNAGTYNFSDHTTTATKGTNWIDRRPWARGAKFYYWNGNATYTTSASTYQNIDATNMQARLECSGVPVRCQLFGIIGSSAGQVNIATAMNVDGTIAVGSASNSQNNSMASSINGNAGSLYQSGAVYDWETTPAAGSHLFTAMWNALVHSAAAIFGVGAPYGAGMRVEEVLRPSAVNGVA